jgi:hypothetical protein
MGFFDKVGDVLKKAGDNIGKNVPGLIKTALPIASGIASFIPGIGPLASQGITALANNVLAKSSVPPGGSVPSSPTIPMNPYNNLSFTGGYSGGVSFGGGQTSGTTVGVPMWAWIVGGILLVFGLIAMIFGLTKKKK